MVVILLVVVVYTYTPHILNSYSSTTTMPDFPPSEASSTSADLLGSSYSTNPTTPGTSPLFRPAKDPQLAQLTQLDPQRCGPVQNVCVVGAGYVGKRTLVL